ncbi:MAG: THUMP domain-containing protein, partial [Chloroflexota bacterium]
MQNVRMHRLGTDEPPYILATTTPGLEDVALQECLELTGRRGWLEHRGMVGMSGGEDEVCLLNVFSQSLFRVYLVIARGRIGGLEDIHEICSEARYGQLMRTEQSLAVRSERHGEHDFTSQDVGRVAGAGIIESIQAETQARPPVNLDEPDVIFRAEVRDDHFWLGLDTTGEQGLG